MEIAGRFQLMDPGIKIGQGGLAATRVLVALAPRGRRGLITVAAFVDEAACPNLGSMFKPPLPVRSPDDLLYVFFSALEWIVAEHRAHNLFFGDEAMSNEWRE
jgi:hypothetical protein